MAKSRKAAPTGRRWIKWIFLAPLLLVLLVQLYFFAMVCWYSQFNPGSTSFMREQLSQLREKNPDATLKHQWVPYERISRNLKRAVVASEDANFSVHGGVDWEAIERAYERNQRRSKVVGGGSTITQQLVKNFYLNNQQTLVRKAKEALMAILLDAHYSKPEILEDA